MDVDEFISGVCSLGFSLVDQVCNSNVWNPFKINYLKIT